MTDTRNSSLEKLSTEELIARKRDIKREINLRIQRQYNLHAAPRDISQPSAEDKKQAADLLAYIDKADYDNIEHTWKQNPELMFIEVTGKDGEITTPLKRALYNVDTWSWKPFYEWIKQNNADLELTFIEQNTAQESHIDLNYLQPLLDEYTIFDAQIQKWYRNEILDDELDRQWKKLFEKQREILPMHMIREMCREDNDMWSPESRFDAKMPKAGQVHDIRENKYIKINSEEFITRFGTSLGLVRGVEIGVEPECCCAFKSCFGGGGWLAQIDADSFRQLCNVRTSDLASIPTLAHVEDNAPTLRK